MGWWFDVSMLVRDIDQAYTTTMMTRLVWPESPWKLSSWNSRIRRRSWLRFFLQRDSTELRSTINSISRRANNLRKRVATIQFDATVDKTQEYDSSFIIVSVSSLITLCLNFTFWIYEIFNKIVLQFVKSNIFILQTFTKLIVIVTRYKSDTNIIQSQFIRA